MSSDTSNARKFTQSMSMHMNGDKFSVLQYTVLCDGEKTRIMRSTRTNGRPQYLKTSDVFVCDGDEFDVLASKGKGLIGWLNAHVDL